MTTDLDLTIAGQPVRLLPERAVLLCEPSVLVLSDLHLGKADTHRSLGIDIPEGVIEESLERLEHMVLRTRPQKVMILGDLVQCEEGMEEPVVELFERWRRRVTVPMSLIGGDHEIDVSIPRSWRIDDDGQRQRVGPFLLQHEPESSPGEEDTPFVLAGHRHPVLSLGSGIHRVLAHAFVIDPHQLILPAFTPFARGARVQPDVDRPRRVFPITDGRVSEA